MTPSEVEKWVSKSGFFPRNTSGSECAQKIIETCEKKKIKILLAGSLLGEIPRPPHLLFVKGEFTEKRRGIMAVVGSRRPSAYGIKCAFGLSLALAKRGFSVVSGLARGIDTAAHRGALKGQGRTLAVLGSGLNRIYPRENLKLSEEIVGEGGCLITEFPPDYPPLKQNFPRRNRLISGLSSATIVVEAGEKSGSLITANWALSQGRDVYVVPGSIFDERYLGSHRLIQSGAYLFRSLSDLISEESEIGFSGEMSHPLEKVFCRLDGKGNLSELFSLYSGTLTDLLDALDAAMEAGFVVETGPQEFVWVADSAFSRSDALKSLEVTDLPNPKRF